MSPKVLQVLRRPLCKSKGQDHVQRHAWARGVAEKGPHLCDCLKAAEEDAQERPCCIINGKGPTNNLINHIRGPPLLPGAHKDDHPKHP